MRTLRVTNEWRRAPPADWDGEAPTACCLLPEDGRLLVLAGDRLWRVGGRGHEEVGRVEEGLGRCVRLLNLGDGAALAAFADGSLARLEVGGPFAFEEVGLVSDGLVEASQSPDEELVVLVTGAGKVVIMNREFDPLGEVELHQEAFGAGQFVNVGWGKKETQFHGSLGKQAAVAKENPAGLTRSPFDDGSVRVAWRDDGERFSVSYLPPGDDKSGRVIRIFDREGVLQATSESIAGLEHSLTWKPSSSLMTTTVRSPNKYEVAFVEKNGLRHGGFVLQLEHAGVVVTDVLWSRNADALLVLSKSIEANRQAIHIYKSSNYHWTLQQARESLSTVRHIQWDQNADLRFHFLTEEGHLTSVQLDWEVCCSDSPISPTSSGDDVGVDPAFVARLDGNVALVTPFRSLVLPPPLSAFDLSVPAHIRQVIFSPVANGRPPSIVLATEDALYVFSPEKGGSTPNRDLPGVRVIPRECGATGNGFRQVVTPPVFSRKLRLPKDKDGNLLNWCCLSPTQFLACAGKTIRLLCVDNDDIEGTLKEQSSLQMNDDVSRLCRDASARHIAAQLANGEVHRISVESGQLSSSPWIAARSGMAVRPRIPYSKLSLMVDSQQQDSCCRLLGLTRGNRLHLDGEEVCTDASSFALHSDFVLVTDLKHRLRCLPISALKTCSAESTWLEESLRSVERGAKLVVAVPGQSTVVLQMPRGNLEAIHPRALTLRLSTRLLDLGQFGRAFELFRRHRVDLNLLVDHNPDGFDAKKLVEQCNDAQRLAVVVADLKNEDCTLTTYAAHYPSRVAKLTPSEDKVRRVCETLLREMESFDPERLINAIVSCLVKGAPDADEGAARALNRIAKARASNNKLANDALQFLLLLVDVNRLFDVALGTYDFDLVLFVAEKSQKDPKEFLPRLNELKSLPEPYRKFKIDVQLRRFSKAFGHVADWSGLEEDAEKREECLKVVAAQRMYKEALAIFPKGGAMFPLLSEKYGAYLHSKKYYDEAALIYWNANLKRLACDCWEQGLDWRRYLAAAKSNPDLLGAAEMTSSCRRMADGLRAKGRRSEAAALLLEQLGDEEEAVAALVEGGCWAEADRVIAKHRRNDLYETHYLPGLKEAAESATAAADASREELSQSLSRFRTVTGERQRRLDVWHAEGGGGGDAGGLFDPDDNADLFSDTTSVATTRITSGAGGSNPALSLRTRVTQRSKSSKNRRKNEKKKYSTREGSAFEDIGLMAEMHRIATAAFKSTESTGELLRALVMARETSNASRLQSGLESLLKLCAEACKEVWVDAAGQGSEGDQGANAGGHRFGPDASTADIVGRSAATATSEGQRKYSPPIHLLEPHLRVSPTWTIQETTWKLEIL